MTKKELKQTFLNYFESCLNEIKMSEKLESYYTSSIQCRELLGATRFAWFYDYITTQEYKDIKIIIYEHLKIAEQMIRKS